MHEGTLPRRDAIVDLLSSQTRALHAREIASQLDVGEAAYPGLLRLLDDMAFMGAISPQSGQKFRAKRGVAEARGQTREGFLNMNPRGFGFVASVGFADDLYVPEEALGGAMHGDLVEARLVTRSSRGSEGAVVRVVKRNNTRVAGVLRRRGKSAWLEPDDTRLRGPVVLNVAAAGNDGDAAVARIVRFPELPREAPEGELEAVLGVPGDPNVEVEKVLVREAIEEEHPPAAVAEADAYGKEVAKAALAGREDLTHLPLPTIDPEDARDHDDAVWAERAPDGSYTIWVAIADVSHYVRPSTAIDEAALARGCSIYLPDRAIPMLPRALSSNLCSLLPKVIRLCLCVEAKLDPTGEVKSYRVFEGFMRSAAKLTYGGVARTLKYTDRPARSDEAEAMVDGLRVLADLSGLLRAKRLRRGALDFDLPEAKLVLDEETGAPTAIERRAEDPGVKKAYQLIEEMMLLANELVAQYLSGKGVPAIYRVHGAPDEEKLDRFATMCKTLGVPFELDDAKDPKKLSALLKKVARLPQANVFNMLLLRAMKQATYDVTNIGHFGLASQAYLHFTSPIRRYPDLVVHRITRALVRGEKIDKGDQAVDGLKASATAASQREREAMDVEREVVDLYRALYMRGRVGETFEGTVTAIVGTGVFVQLDSPFVDVLVRMEALGQDSYEVDDDALRIVGRRSGDMIALGDRMKVLIEDVAILRRSVYGRRVGESVGAAAHPKPAGKKTVRELEAKGKREPQGKHPMQKRGRAKGGKGRGKRR